MCEQHLGAFHLLHVYQSHVELPRHSPPQIEMAPKMLHSLKVPEFCVDCKCAHSCGVNYDWQSVGNSYVVYLWTPGIWTWEVQQPQFFWTSFHEQVWPVLGPSLLPAKFFKLRGWDLISQTLLWALTVFARWKSALSFMRKCKFPANFVAASQLSLAVNCFVKCSNQTGIVTLTYHVIPRSCGPHLYTKFQLAVVYTQIH